MPEIDSILLTKKKCHSLKELQEIPDQGCCNISCSEEVNLLSLQELKSGDE